MSGRGVIEPRDVAEIIALLDQSPYDRFTLDTPRLKVSFVRSGEGWTQEWQHGASSAPLAAVAAPVAAEFAPQATEERGIAVVRPPLPGIFYRAPKPGAEPFVKPGDVIAPDTVVGIVETMKVMNSVPAGVAGEVIEILARDGEMVLQADRLLRVRTAP